MYSCTSACVWVRLRYEDSSHVRKLNSLTCLTLSPVSWCTVASCGLSITCVSSFYSTLSLAGLYSPCLGGTRNHTRPRYNTYYYNYKVTQTLYRNTHRVALLFLFAHISKYGALCCFALRGGVEVDMDFCSNAATFFFSA